MTERYQNNPIVTMTFEYALNIIQFSEQLQERRKFVLADQILRSGCGIGANVREAQNAESKADFIHKMKIAAKEAEENEYWLLLCKGSRDYHFDEQLLTKLESIMKVLNKIIGTSKRTL